MQTPDEVGPLLEAPNTEAIPIVIYAESMTDLIDSTSSELQPKNETPTQPATAPVPLTAHRTYGEDVDYLYYSIHPKDKALAIGAAVMAGAVSLLLLFGLPLVSFG